jgi:hypothetical protein
MKVYIVIDRYESRIFGAFSTQEKAEKFQSLLREEEGEDTLIDKAEVDSHENYPQA